MTDKTRNPPTPPHDRKRLDEDRAGRFRESVIPNRAPYNDVVNSRPAPANPHRDRDPDKDRDR